MALSIWVTCLKLHSQELEGSFKSGSSLCDNAWNSLGAEDMFVLPTC